MKSRSSSKRQKWFSDMTSNRIKPRSFAGGQDNGFHKHGYLERCTTDGATAMRITIGWIAAAALLSGCGGDVRAKVSIPTMGEAISGNAAFDQYKRAAEDVEERAAKHIGRTAWTPDQRDFIVDAAGPAIRSLSGIEGAKLGRTWESPFGVRQHTRGWRMIGRSLAWRIERAVKEENYEDARLCLRTAMRMADALATSDSHDALLGLEIVDECIDAAWQHLPGMEADTLAGIGADFSRFIEHVPASEATVEQERALMLAQADWVLSRYQERDFKAINETLGEAVEPAVKYLRELSEQPADAQQAYFTAFGDELHEETEWFSQRLRSAPYQWKEETERGSRGWMRFTRAFGIPWRVYASRRAEVKTRLRLFALDATLLAQFMRSGNVAEDLSGFSKAVRTDPFSGKDLVFVSRGVDYKLYSVGPDRSDGGGDRGDLSLGR